MVLRAPMRHSVTERPFNIGRVRWSAGKVAGVRLKLVPPGEPGELNVQVVLRGFGTVPAETIGDASVQIDAQTSELSVPLTPPAALDGQFVYYTVEPWLIWRGAKPLQLVAEPEPY
jgi:hypothetical protein